MNWGRNDTDVKCNKCIEMSCSGLHMFSRICWANHNHNHNRLFTKVLLHFSFAFIQSQLFGLIGSFKLFHCSLFGLNRSVTLFINSTLRSYIISLTCSVTAVEPGLFKCLHLAPSTVNYLRGNTRTSNKQTSE